MPFVTIVGQKVFYAYHTLGVDNTQAHAPLVLIHGAGGNHLHWPPQLRRLAGGPIYALDLPGHGRSAGDSCTTIAEYASWLQAFVDTLQLSPFVLAGHSMGGAIALDFALNDPTRLVGLGLVGTNARLRVAPAILNGIQQDFTATTAHLIDLMVVPTANAQQKRLALQRLRQVDPVVLFSDFSACDQFDVSARMTEIALPTLIICGQQDKMTPVKYSERLHEQLRHSELHLLADAGHMVMLEKPAEVAQLFAQFLDKINPILVIGER
jgi:pimeloyl-ACP methyl ester carboxylesterase